MRQGGVAVAPGAGLRAFAALDQAAIDLLPVGVCVCAADGAPVRWNRAAEALWGRAPRRNEPSERFAGAWRLYGVDGARLATERTPIFEVLQAGGGRRSRELVLERPDGGRRAVALTAEALSDAAGQTVGAVVCFLEIESRAAPAPSGAERRARELLEVLPAAIYTTDSEGRITFYNAAAVELLGGAPDLGDARCCGPWWKLYTPDGAPLGPDNCAMAATLRENRPVRGAEIVVERPDGSRRPILPFPTPLCDGRGRLVGAVNMLVDVSEQKEAEARQRLLLDELNHRVKNTLATVQSLAFQTLRHTASLEAFRESFETRLVALGRAHDLLTRRCWQGADIRDVVVRELDPWSTAPDDRTRIEGPSVELGARQALALVLVVHELTTNAVKHGALGAAEGAVAVTWRREADETLTLTWTERGGPPVRAPERRGFGSLLIQRSVATELGGRADLTWAPEGLSCTLSFPLRS